MTLAKQDLYWAVRRLPVKLRELLKRQGASIVVAGGFIRSSIAQELISDIDVFVPSPEIGKALTKELAGDTKVVETENAVTICWKLPVQFITRWVFDSPLKVVQAFDFTIASAAIWYDADTKKWESLCHADFYADLAAKRLVYLSPQRNEDAGGSLLRVLKFYQRGYRIPLDSFGAVIARLMRGVQFEQSIHMVPEDHVAMVVTGLLREVDPLIDPEHLYHLPVTDEELDA